MTLFRNRVIASDMERVILANVPKIEQCRSSGTGKLSSDFSC